MEKSEILKRAFEKARDNGWKQDFWYGWSEHAWEDYSENDEHLMFIFKHDFAKAFWKKIHPADEHAGWSWESHLQQMVLQEEPLEYLRPFIEAKRG